MCTTGPSVITVVGCTHFLPCIFTYSHLFSSFIAGGDSKLMILLCVSPAQRYLNESQRCLQFGSRARQIQRGAAKVKTIARQH